MSEQNTDIGAQGAPEPEQSEPEQAAVTQDDNTQESPAAQPQADDAETGPSDED